MIKGGIKIVQIEKTGDKSYRGVYHICIHFVPDNNLPLNGGVGEAPEGGLFAKYEYTIPNLTTVE